MEITLIRSKEVPQRKNNEAGWPKTYKCNFLEAGFVSYEDIGQGTCILKKETMDTWIQTFVGKPVIIDHQDIDPANFKRVAVGYITRIWFDPVDAWYWCEFLITDDEGHKAIQDGYSVSCSFDVIDTAPGGEYHAQKYDEEIIRGEGQHLALVTSPRYEDCRIVANAKNRLFNSKDAKVYAMTNDTDFTLMSPIGLDKYMSALSDVGLQTIVDGEYDEEVKKVAQAHVGDRAKKKEEEDIASEREFKLKEKAGKAKNSLEVTISVDTEGGKNEVDLSPFASMTNVELAAKLRQVPSQMAIEPNTEKKLALEAEAKAISAELEKRKAKGEYIPTNQKLNWVTLPNGIRWRQ
jgi:hypothetical protein